MKKLWKFKSEEQIKIVDQQTNSKEFADKIFEDPGAILSQYAYRVFEDTDKQFKGIVTEALSDNSNEATYALYIVAPELNDYMYRLIEVNVPNIIESYPLEITLFAKDPKNHRTFNCENAITFRKKTEELISSPITRLILNHLKAMTDIKNEYVIKNYNFELTDRNPTKTFSLKVGSSPIAIKRIVLKSHLGKVPNEWGDIIANSFLEVITTNNITKDRHENTISLMQFLSLYQVQPVLELNLVLPDYNFYSLNKSSLCDLRLTLICKDKTFDFDIFYNAAEELLPSS
jgi:hypothetical protein